MMMKRRTRGFTLLEVMIAVLVLVLAIFGVLAAINTSAISRQLSVDTERAAHIMQTELEKWRGFPTNIAAQGIWTAVDSGGNANTPEASFSIGKDETGKPLLAKGVGVVRLLSEAEAETAFGLGAGTLDLDGDGTNGEDDANSDRTQYQVVPLRITLTWTSISAGPRTAQTETILYPKG